MFPFIGDSRDQKTVERLRAERQAKIDELKERTNYYITQQLIQVHLRSCSLSIPNCCMHKRKVPKLVIVVKVCITAFLCLQKYDTDPAAKAAAASVLASKLGAESGLKVYLGDESQQNYSEATGKSHDVEPVTSSGLRKRNTTEATSKGGNDLEMYQHAENEISPHDPVVVEHQNPKAFGSQDGGWIARLAQLLVGEDPSQSYALICGSCHMHNGKYLSSAKLHYKYHIMKLY